MLFVAITLPNGTEILLGYCTDFTKNSQKCMFRVYPKDDRIIAHSHHCSNVVCSYSEFISKSKRMTTGSNCKDLGKKGSLQWYGFNVIFSNTI